MDTTSWSRGRLSGRMGEKGEKRKGGRGPPAISASGRRRESLEGRTNMREKEAEQTQAACLDLKGKEGGGWMFAEGPQCLCVDAGKVRGRIQGHCEDIGVPFRYVYWIFNFFKF